jgi:two-component system CheB/CheR fusion protein
MIAFDLQETLDSVTSEAYLEADPKGVEISCRVDANVMTRLVGDAYRLRRSLQLLLSHAVDVSPSGTVKLWVKSDSLGADRQSLRFEVRDSQRRTDLSLEEGAVVPLDDETSDLFLWFQLTRLMTGDLGIHCSLEHGNTCWFTVGYDLARDGETKGRPSRRVLVVDDNIVNQKVACHMIRKLGYEVDVCSDGKQAVAAVKDGDYGLVLMDCQMPVMDGYQATEAIRQREAGSSHIPIVALTAHALDENRRLCFATGMDGFLAKPVTGDSLGQVLADWIPAG